MEVGLESGMQEKINSQNDRKKKGKKKKDQEGLSAERNLPWKVKVIKK